MALQLTDTHCHLYFENYKKDLVSVLRRAEDAGVYRILVPGIDIRSSLRAIELAEKKENIFVAAGIHPNSATQWGISSARDLKEILRHPKVIAVGEIGLDYYRNITPREIQASIFVKQLEIAESAGLPVVIHNRDATEDILSILGSWQNGLKQKGKKLANTPGVLHSYLYDVASAQKAIRHNFFIGITGPITFKNAESIRDVVTKLPMKKILLETDGPFLTPHPLRGKRNEPANVKLIAEKIAKLTNISTNEVARISTVNADILFGWG